MGCKPDHTQGFWSELFVRDGWSLCNWHVIPQAQIQKVFASGQTMVKSRYPRDAMKWLGILAGCWMLERENEGRESESHHVSSLSPRSSTKLPQSLEFQELYVNVSFHPNQANHKESYQRITRQFHGKVAWKEPWWICTPQGLPSCHGRNIKREDLFRKPCSLFSSNLFESAWKWMRKSTRNVQTVLINCLLDVHPEADISIGSQGSITRNIQERVWTYQNILSCPEIAC